MNSMKNSTHQLKIDKGELYYEIYGSGQPILLLAGGPGFSADYLIPFAKRLASMGQQSILLHQRGTGKSKMEDISPLTMTVEEATLDIQRLRNELGLEQWIVLGHSWGALLAANYVTKEEQAVSKLIFICSAGITNKAFTYLLDNVFQRLSKDNFDKAQKLFLGLESSPNPAASMVAFLKVVQAAYFYDQTNAEEHSNFFTEETFSLPTYGLLATDLIESGFDLRNHPSINTPTLDILSRQDLFGFEPHHDIQNLFTNLDRHIIEQAGHYPWIDQPDTCFDILGNFLLN
jgi:proline iminopeptidase